MTTVSSLTTATFGLVHAIFDGYGLLLSTDITDREDSISFDWSELPRLSRALRFRDGLMLSPKEYEEDADGNVYLGWSDYDYEGLAFGGRVRIAKEDVPALIDWIDSIELDLEGDDVISTMRRKNWQRDRDVDERLFGDSALTIEIEGETQWLYARNKMGDALYGSFDGRGQWYVLKDGETTAEGRPQALTKRGTPRYYLYPRGIKALPWIWVRTQPTGR